MFFDSGAPIGNCSQLLGFKARLFRFSSLQPPPPHPAPCIEQDFLFLAQDAFLQEVVGALVGHHEPVSGDPAAGDIQTESARGSQPQPVAFGLLRVPCVQDAGCSGVDNGKEEHRHRAVDFRQARGQPVGQGSFTKPTRHNLLVG